MITNLEHLGTINQRFLRLLWTFELYLEVPCLTCFWICNPSPLDASIQVLKRTKLLDAGVSIAMPMLSPEMDVSDAVTWLCLTFFL